MDEFVLGSVLVAMVPILFTARAWWILVHDRSYRSGQMAGVVLFLNSASALLFVLTMLLAITQSSVVLISGANACLCILITVLSGVKIRSPLYRAVFISSAILTLAWLIAASLH